MINIVPNFTDEEGNIYFTVDESFYEYLEENSYAYGDVYNFDDEIRVYFSHDSYDIVAISEKRLENALLETKRQVFDFINNLPVSYRNISERYQELTGNVEIRLYETVNTKGAFAVNDEYIIELFPEYNGDSPLGTYEIVALAMHRKEIV